MIGFVGLSHLGLNYSLATAAKGFDVVAYDPDAMVTARCAAGEFPIEEPGFGDLFAQHRDRIRYTSDETALAKCELVFYSLDVRTNDSNESDPGPLTALIRATAPKLSPGTIAVVLSQVAPGYMRELRTELREVSAATREAHEARAGPQRGQADALERAEGRVAGRRSRQRGRGLGAGTEDDAGRELDRVEGGHGRGEAAR